jgi:hypothetical protein
MSRSGACAGAVYKSRGLRKISSCMVEQKVLRSHVANNALLLGDGGFSFFASFVECHL